MIWYRSKYYVKEEHGVFAVYTYDGDLISHIVTGTEEDHDNIIEALNAGECVNGWEDGIGNTIIID